MNGGLGITVRFIDNSILYATVHGNENGTMAPIPLL